MNPSPSRGVRRAALLTSLLLLRALPGAAADDADVALTLEDAVARATQHQPLLQAQAAGARSARESAVAARQLPDPKLVFGVRDLPVDTSERFSLERDSDTQLMVGVSQEFPRAAKRRLLGERGEREAEMAEQELEATRLSVRRDAGLAWIDAWRAERAIELARHVVGEADAQDQAARIAYTAGSANQADVLTAQLATRRLRDDLAGIEQQAAHARSTLSRWIGDDAYGLLCPDLPEWPAPPPLPDLLAHLVAHPHLNHAEKQIEVAAADVALARAAYRPDWRVALDYGHRQRYSEMVSLQFGIDLPLFAGDRQDRGVAAKLQEQERAVDLRDDLRRQQEAEARLNLGDWTRLQERLAHYDSDLLPLAAQRIESARLEWQTQRGTLAAILDARRMQLELRLARLDLQADAARHRLNLLYLAGELP